jgi:hypothetical protein
LVEYLEEILSNQPELPKHLKLDESEVILRKKRLDAEKKKNA